MALTKIPSYSGLSDAQLISIDGADGIQTSYVYDKQTRSLLAKESQAVISASHGIRHITSDQIPEATCDTPGLLSALDKCKLEQLTKTRIGILGFQGAGFATDGGWLDQDIIFAAGSEFISIERIGNVIRFVVDMPVPFSCGVEACAQIYWVQDETEPSAIRPPSCAGKLPGIDCYGEMKFYLFPEQTILNQSNPSSTLSAKGNYPAFIFKRYDDATVTGSGEIELVLQREDSNYTETKVGWAFNPGASGIAECIWFTGHDDVGNRTEFKIVPNSDADLLGFLQYKGHLLTKTMAVVTNYSPTTLSTNQYKVKILDTVNGTPTGSEVTATNLWGYDNVNNPTSGTDARVARTDKDFGLLPLGSVVDLWFFQVGQTGNTPIRRYYFIKEPNLSSSVLWENGDSVSFGDLISSRMEILPGSNDTDIDAFEVKDTSRTIESTLWGMTGMDDPIVLFGTEGDTDRVQIASQHRASFDTDLPGLVVATAGGTSAPFSNRPVMVWNRRNFGNVFATVNIGLPDQVEFPPYDFLFCAPIDSYTPVYMQVSATGTLGDPTQYWLGVKGAAFKELPNYGVLRWLDGNSENQIWPYSQKLVFPASDPHMVVLASSVAPPGSIGDVVELLHQEFNSPIVRAEFDYSDTQGEWELTFKVGTLDMSVAYEGDVADDLDDYVRGLSEGYSTSATYSQAGTFSGVGTAPTVSHQDFIIYNGGIAGITSPAEYWNKLDIVYKDGHVWLWWNDLLIPPLNDTVPYFTVSTELSRGKFGMRLWPGAKVRDAIVRGQSTQFSEYSREQLELA